MSKVILQDCKSRNKNVCMAWADHQKAVDSVPHSWIIKSLKLTEINNKVKSHKLLEVKYVLTYRWEESTEDIETQM
jgi:hypothetical protein